MKITVNCMECQVSTERVSYERIAELAERPGAKNLSVTYHGSIVIDGERYEKNGILCPGESVKALDGMHFAAIWKA